MNPHDWTDPLWVHVAAKRRERQERRQNRGDALRGAYHLFAAAVAYVAITRTNRERQNLYELVGRFALAAGVYLAWVYGTKPIELANRKR